jgi:hypothetical protein
MQKKAMLRTRRKTNEKSPNQHTLLYLEEQHKRIFKNGKRDLEQHKNIQAKVY